MFLHPPSHPQSDHPRPYEVSSRISSSQGQVKLDSHVYYFVLLHWGFGFVHVISVDTFWRVSCARAPYVIY